MRGSHLRYYVLFALALLVIKRTECCNLTAVEKCVMDIRQDYTFYCGRHHLAEAQVYACQTSSQCTNPTKDPDYSDALSEIKLACDVYMPCGEYYSCIGKLVDIDFHKVLMNDPVESQKADSLPSFICGNRTRYNLDQWPTCVQANPACMNELETILGSDDVVTFIQMDSGFTEILNRFGTAKSISTYLDHFCSPECYPVLNQVMEVVHCAQWPDVAIQINQKSAQNMDTSQECQQLSKAITCLKDNSKSCDPVLEYFHEFAEDIGRAKPGAYVVQAASVCGLDIPKPTYTKHSSAATSLKIWFSVTLCSVIMSLTTV